MNINAILYPELRAQIFSYLNIKDTAKAAEVCRQWQGEIKLKHLASKYFHTKVVNRNEFKGSLKMKQALCAIIAGNEPQEIDITDDHPALKEYDAYYHGFVKLLSEGLSTQALEKAIKTDQSLRKLDLSNENREKFEKLKLTFNKAFENDEYNL